MTIYRNRSIFCRIMHCFTVSMAAFAAFCLVSCAEEEYNEKPDPNYTVQPKDHLTRAETDLLVRQAQAFAVSVPQIRQKMTQQQREYVQNTRPAVQIRYWGPKTGFLEMRWRIAKKTELVVTAKGRLLKRKPNWKVEVCITEESAPVPEGLLSPELEKNLALPPK